MISGFRGRDPLGLDFERCLTIVSEERETWTAASLRGLVAGLASARAEVRVGEGNRRDADGHVSKFIALGLMGPTERREAVGRVRVGADVFGTRQ